jgi:two-component system CheB/CheR fusion protein
VLIVDDSVANANSLRDLLNLLFDQYQVAVAYDGREGLLKARQLRPDIVMCDMCLPDMDGYDLASVFRADPTLRHARLIAVTGCTQPSDHQRAAAAGVEWVLVKPIDVAKMEQILRGIERDAPQPPSMD